MGVSYFESGFQKKTPSIALGVSKPFGTHIGTFLF